MATAFICRNEQKYKEEILKYVNKITGRLSFPDFDSISHVDIHILKDNLKNSIGIDDIKELFKKMQFRPMLLDIQFGIILRAEILTIEAQNCLLKTLEEHSSFSEYILGVSDENLLLPTIKSRCNLIFVKDDLLQNTNLELAIQFNNMNLLDKMLFSKTLCEDNNKITNVNQFLNTLLQLNQNFIENQKNEYTASQNIKLISKIQKFINSNTNLLLSLENLAIKYINIQ